MICNNPTWLIYAIDAALITAAILLVIVMQKTQHDRFHSRHDPRWIRDARRGSFIAVAMLACFTILTDISLLAICLLIWSTVVLLAINVAALQARPPITGVRSAGHAIRWAPLWRALASFREDLKR